MSSKFIWLALILLLSIGGVVALRKTNHKKEMANLESTEIQGSKVNMEEYWPFPKTLSATDPFVLELEQMNLQN